MPSRVQRLKWRSNLVNENLVVNTGGTRSRAGCSICHLIFFARNISYFDQVEHTIIPQGDWMILCNFQQV